MSAFRVQDLKRVRSPKKSTKRNKLVKQLSALHTACRKFE